MSPAGGFRLLVDLPTFLQTFPKALQGATVAAHKETITTWRDRPAFPGLAHRFTWAASRNMPISMRKKKYGSPTALRINMARAGLGMPREARPGAGGKGVRLGASQAPNINKPWYVNTGATRAKLLARKPRSTISGGQVITRFSGSGGSGINLLGGEKMRGVATAHWVHVPVSYPMRVYKDAVNKAGAYTVMVTRSIPRWVHTYASQTYRQEFENLTHDLPWIQRLAQASLRNNLRDLVIDNRGRVRLRYRKAMSKAGLDPAEIAMLQGGN
jgi:hypothetical protein